MNLKPTGVDFPIEHVNEIGHRGALLSQKDQETAMKASTSIDAKEDRRIN